MRVFGVSRGVALETGVAERMWLIVLKLSQVLMSLTRKQARHTCPMCQYKFNKAEYDGLGL